MRTIKWLWVPLALLGACESSPNDIDEPREPVAMTLYVADALVECVGVARQQCMQVKTEPSAAWERFYDAIAGFTYQPGYEYVLAVTRTAVSAPPADGSGYEWRLNEVLSKRPTPIVPPSAQMSAMLDEVEMRVAQAIIDNQEMLPRNQHLAAQIQAKGSLLQRAGLAGNIVRYGYFEETTGMSMDGGARPMLAVFTADSMRAGARGALQYLVNVLPLLESFMNFPIATSGLRVWYGFALGNSGGGGVLNMEDRGTYEGRTPATRLPFDAILAHELAHSYVGNEALTQFLELYAYNVGMLGSPNVQDWTHVRGYVPNQVSNENIHAVLDVYQLIGLERMKAAYRAIRPLYPSYGVPLRDDVQQAFLNAVPQEHRAQVAAKLARITF